MALINKLNNIGDAIRSKTGKEDKLTLEQMVTEINGIEVGTGGADLPEEAFVITGDCSHRFANGGWDWFIKKCGDKITTNGIMAVNNMFRNSEVEEIPFSLNFNGNKISADYMFDGCKNLKSAPYLNNLKPESLKDFFKNCYHLKELPMDYADSIDWSAFETLTSAYKGDRSGTFNNCYSLRSFPMAFLEHGNPIAAYSYGIYNSLFNNCYALDEIVGLPVCNKTKYTTGLFGSAFNKCNRLKRLTFATQDDGTPYVAQWHTQTIDLTKDVGCAPNEYQGETFICGYNSGITTDKAVYDDTTYQSLKNDPDWYAYTEAIGANTCPYSRYNHDSAAETLQSLPDTSEYLSTQGSNYSNTIKFRGENGSKTDGGAINTLTEEEIAVATAKGWTVTFA